MTSTETTQRMAPTNTHHNRTVVLSNSTDTWNVWDKKQIRGSAQNSTLTQNCGLYWLILATVVTNTHTACKVSQEVTYKRPTAVRQPRRSEHSVQSPPCPSRRPTASHPALYWTWRRQTPLHTSIVISIITIITLYAIYSTWLRQTPLHSTQPGHSQQMSCLPHQRFTNYKPEIG